MIKRFSKWVKSRGLNLPVASRLWHAIIKLLLLTTMLFIFILYGVFSIFFNNTSSQNGLQTNLNKNQSQKPCIKTISDDSPQIVFKETDLYLFKKQVANETKQCELNPFVNGGCQIKAQESKMFPQQNLTECINITCKLTTNNNSVATLQAPKAFINHTDKTIHLPGTVTGSLSQNHFCKHGSTQTKSHNFSNWNLEKQDVFFNAKKQIIQAKKTKINSINNPLKISTQSDKSTINLKNESILLEGNVISHLTK